MATIIKTDGTREDYQPAGPKFTLSELQKSVGGDIEVVYSHYEAGNSPRSFDTQAVLDAVSLRDEEAVLLANEDGLVLELPFNGTATPIAGSHIVGDVLLLTRAEWDRQNEE